MEFLLFQLYGPMASWGDVAVGEQRPSDVRPSKSAVLGLVAAALGVRRDQEPVHTAMAEGYKFAVVVLQPGQLLRDYHSVQVPPEAALKRRRVATRRDELAALKEYRRDNRSASGTLLSTREYRMDAVYRIGLWVSGDRVPFSLGQISDALMRPRFNLYLGRKSCPLAVPFQPQLIDARDFRSAYDQARFVGPSEFLDWSPPHWLHVESTIWHWDAAVDIGLEPQQTVVRRDVTRARSRWQFDERLEHQAVNGSGRKDVH